MHSQRLMIRHKGITGRPNIGLKDYKSFSDTKRKKDEWVLKNMASITSLVQSKGTQRSDTDFFS